MKVSCPTCGRGTNVEADIGDFPTRCQRCGGLLRRPPQPPESTAPAPAVIRGLSLRRADPPAAPGTRIERGALAGLLTSRPPREPEVFANIPAPTASFEPKNEAVEINTAEPVSAPAPASPSVILRPESRRQIARAAARQQALRRAHLRGNHQALGALGWAGFALVALLAICIFFLKAHIL